MGPSPSLFSLSLITLTLTLTLLHLHIILVAAAQETPPPTDPIIAQQHSTTTFKPGVAIVVGVTTLVFSLTFLLLLYIKHCSGANIHSINNSSGGGILSSSSRGVPQLTAAAASRKNSGIDRSVVESLPIFRFGSLTGQKDGLDCAVCLNKFESAEVLRLLPKCKHAFHVECVDTWLDAHSTCPLCRYRVDPEDILLVLDRGDSKTASMSKRNKNNKEETAEEECLDIEKGVIITESKRRHSSVGEREWEVRRKTASFRWSLDSCSSSRKNKNESSVGVGVGIGIGCFVRPRKDGMLLTATEERTSAAVERRLEHRIIVSPSVPPHTNSGVHIHQRWSDVQPCDLLYLTSEMIISEARRRGKNKNNREQSRDSSTNDDDRCNGSRGIINSRSVSEITGLSRFQSSNSNNNINGTEREREREEGLVSRWLAWISHSHSHPAVR